MKAISHVLGIIVAFWLITKMVGWAMGLVLFVAAVIAAMLCTWWHLRKLKKKFRS
jgi:DNA-binding transcriptional regulator of glucitol operon